MLNGLGVSSTGTSCGSHTGVPSEECAVASDFPVGTSGLSVTLPLRSSHTQKTSLPAFRMMKPLLKGLPAASRNRRPLVGVLLT